jgi:hypothetical protein
MFKRYFGELQSSHDDNPADDEFTDAELEEAARDVVADMDDVEIWCVPGAAELVLAHYGAKTVDDDPTGRAFEWLDVPDMLAVPGVMDTLIDHVIRNGEAEGLARKFREHDQRMRDDAH